MDRVSVDSGHIARTAKALRDVAEGMRSSGDQFAGGFQGNGYGNLPESDDATAQTWAVVQAVLDGVRGQADELLKHADALDRQASDYRSAENHAEQAATRLGLGQ
ncbi:hypothetical protein AB0H34_02815 [Saccharopolyspora shandongensis]|uniref:hypothetical protein n=1 Tax=Saccharopolyspora shandongensis TaxID=418495 RepID=UPI0033DAEB54